MRKTVTLKSRERRSLWLNVRARMVYTRQFVRPRAISIGVVRQESGGRHTARIIGGR